MQLKLPTLAAACLWASCWQLVHIVPATELILIDLFSDTRTMINSYPHATTLLLAVVALACRPTKSMEVNVPVNIYLETLT